MSWRMGIATGCSVHTPIAATLEAFAAAGVTSVEIGTPPGHFDPWDSAAVRTLGDQLRRLEMHAISIHAPFGGPHDLSEPDAERRHAAVGTALVAASALRDLGGSHVIVHPSDVARDEDAGVRLANSASSLGPLARGCANLGVRLVVETPLPHLVGGQPDEFDWLLRHLDDEVGVCIDTGHVSLGGFWDRFVEVAGRRLVHVHANDNAGQRDDHLPPGDGVIDWARIRRSLEAARFSGWVVLELAYAGSPAPADIARALRCARNLLAY